MRKSKPPVVPRPKPGTLIPVIEAIDGMMPFGRYRIRLAHEDYRGSMLGGSDGWGWLAYTVRGAGRKARRIARRENAREMRLAARTERVQREISGARS